MDNRVYRHEQKYLISLPTAVRLQARLGAVLEPDPNAPQGRYHIRSLYFDDAADTAYFDKVAGLDERSKFRIRHYDHSDRYIVLEKKEKRGPMTRKTSARIDRTTAELLRSGAFRAGSADAPLLREFDALRAGALLRPVVYVDYERIPFVYPESRVRITIDAAVAAGLPDARLFDPDGCRYPVLPDGAAMLEVKFDDHLPPHLLMLLEDVPRQVQAVSKYCLCRSLLG